MNDGSKNHRVDGRIPKDKMARRTTVDVSIYSPCNGEAAACDLSPQIGMVDLPARQAQEKATRENCESDITYVTGKMSRQIRKKMSLYERVQTPAAMLADSLPDTCGILGAQNCDF